MSFEYFHAVDAGRSRSNNEDSVEVDPVNALAVLADGMGGYEAGEVAAALAIQILRRTLTQHRLFAHLAGALAKPVWTLLAFVPEWRWMRDRTDSTWYPTMNLFRQSKPDDWDSVIQSLVPMLQALAAPR